MRLHWIHENPPRWDAPKARIIGGAPDGIFELPRWREGDLLPGEWWRVVEDGEVAGYGWMDCTWGDAEILLAVDQAKRGSGVGGFILERLDAEAAARGLNYLYNVVLPTHPDRASIARWLETRGFSAVHGDERLLRRVGRS